MSRWRTWLAKFGGLVGARRRDRELRDEIASHLDESIDEHIARGLSPAEARRAALRAFGGVAQTEEAYRERVSFRWLDHLRRDVRHTARALRHRPGFSSAVVAVLAIGIGATTAVFALVNHVVLQPLPYPRADRLVAVQTDVPGLKLEKAGISIGQYYFYRARAQSFDAMAVYQGGAVLNWTLPDLGTERVHVTRADAAFFRVLGATPELGRLFTEADGAPGFADTTWVVPILISHNFWMGRLGRDPNVVGRLLTINSLRRVIVGVLPRDFAFPDPTTEIWLLTEPERKGANLRAFRFSAIARLRPGATAASAQAELTRLTSQIAGSSPDATPAWLARLRLAPIVTPLKNAVIGDVAPVLWTLFGAMGVLLLLAGTNAAGLFLVRVEDRRREVAVRQALGADRRQIARVFVAEALLLAIAAAALGLLFAKALLWVVLTVAPLTLPRATEIALGPSSAIVAFGVAALLAVLYGASASRRQDRSITANLHAGSPWATGRRAGRWTRHPLIAVQVALALVLMVGAALMVATYRNLSRTPLGFAPSGLLTVDVGLPWNKAGHYAPVYNALVARIEQLPGVDDAAIASFLPLTGTDDLFPVQPGTPAVPFKFFTPGYFATMGTPVLQGTSNVTDAGLASVHPVLVSAALAHRLYPDRSAVGQPIARLNRDGSPVEMGSGPPPAPLVTIPPLTIVGVVADAREITLRGGPAEAVYVPIIQPNVEPSIVPTDVSLVVRTHGDPLSIAPTVRKSITAFDPGLSVARISTMPDIVLAAGGREAFVGALLLLGAAVSLLLGLVGVYASVAHVVRGRTREIGIRLALGADRAEVFTSVAAGSLRSVAVGSASGIALGLATMGALSALLYGVGARNPAIFIATTAGLLLAATAAAALAARRALSIAPLVAMREE